MTVAAALLDSNVVIAILAEAHEHHAASLALVMEGDTAAYAISAHSYAEAYSTLTRRGDRAPFRFSAEEAFAALESLRAVTRLVGLTPSQTFDVVRAFAAKAALERGSTGPDRTGCAFVRHPAHCHLEHPAYEGPVRHMLSLPISGAPMQFWP